MPSKHSLFRLVFFSAVILPAMAQQSRLAERIDNSRRVALSGHISPKALSGADQGQVNPALVLSEVSIVLQPSQTQKTSLEQFLAEQQDPSSANYHKWLTPEQYADRFGVSQDDINKIVAWLESESITVTSVARGRNIIMVRGTAAQFQAAFHTEFHHYLVNGNLHFANSTDPSIPAALQGVVAAIHGLNDFRMKPASRSRVILPNAARPEYTSATSGNHYLAPNDIAAIYNIKPLFSSGLNGAGQSLVVVGQTQVRMTDIEQYRTYFGLPANDPRVVLVPGAADPGIVSGDLGEAELDLEMSGAIANAASVIFVYSSDVVTSLQYAIDQNLAPVISMSYGSCEPDNLTSDVNQLQSLAQQANAQGMTWFAASGDDGAADCYGDGGSSDNVAAVDMPASLPLVTGVGGTEFNEGSGNYWNAANDATNASVLSYIPEIAWNDSATDGSPSASGGGASIYFSKPSWQAGTGVPHDGARDVPDISISASADHDGYIIFSSDGCSTGRAVTTCKQAVGGTSVGAPIFSGLAALFNQYLVATGVESAPGLGNINPKLYSLAQASPAAFHDITAGNNIITTTCPLRSRGCVPATVGFNAGAGYDQVTGLGTIDAGALLTAWTGRSLSSVGNSNNSNTGSNNGGSNSGGSGSNTTSATPIITAVGNAASYNQRYAPGMLLTIYGSNLSATTLQASSLPLPTSLGSVSVTINSIPAPLYYISAGQLNVQIPYEVTAGSNAVVQVTNNGQSAKVSFTVASAAPGIFTNSTGALAPNPSAARGQTITLFVTGAGAVTPAITDGATPAASTALANLPQPVQSVSVTVGGMAAPTPFQFIGTPSGLVGITQINFQVPAAAPLGSQPVVVTIGGVASAAATLTVTQ
ncbi:MAG: hypothetical protein JO323_15185 [Acidobacteriia bacterium]|nr:hypothetical protein [Terriglobia bacterium]